MYKETQLPYLCEELLLDILCRLPIKSLVRFRSVCKNWRSLFSDDLGFAARYISCNPNPYGYLLNCPKTEPNTHNFALIKDSELNNTLKVHARLGDIIDDNVCPDAVTVIGSIDGVVCFVNHSVHFVLWNPATRDSYQLPSPKISIDLINKSFFGFTRCGSSLSIVRIVRKNCRHQWRNGDPYCCTPEMKAEVYYSSNDNWTEIIGSAPKSFLLCTDECGVVVRGTSYWCTYTWCASIISFSPTSRKFSEFDGPGSRVENSSLGWSLGEISGSLVVLMQSADGGVGAWKMVNDGGVGSRVLWVKQFSVAPPDGVGKVVKCWENGEFLVVSVSSYPNGLMTKLNLYNPWTKNSRLLLEFSAEKGRYIDVFLVVESLISPRGHTICA